MQSWLNEIVSARPIRRVPLCLVALPIAGALLLPARASANPLAGVSLYVKPASNARETADRWRRTRPADAAALDYIASQPTAHWISGSGSVRRNVAAVLAGSAAARAMPVLVAYAIPHRDCGSHSKGGEPDGLRYKLWIREFAGAIRGKRAIVILEPDALAAVGCLDPATREERLALLRDAVSVLKAAKATVYIDAGHAHWHSPEVIAQRLREAGIRGADGFALNVSNYVDNPTTISYGERVSRLVGGKRFVIDTSRNGMGTAPAGAWCNAPGQALGVAPTSKTGHRLVDAFLWIKVPGESDGRCGGGPAAGRWWPEYALGLARRAFGGRAS